MKTAKESTPLEQREQGSPRGTNPLLYSQATDPSLEPGEIRLNKKTKIIDDGERGRRLVIAEDVDEEADHSPHFSNYAPRYDFTILNQQLIYISIYCIRTD